MLMLRWLYLLLGLGQLLAPTSQGQALAAPRKATRRLYWRQERPLKWTDFRAKAFIGTPDMDSVSTGAVSTVTPEMRPGITPQGAHTYTVECVFLCDSSWVNRQAGKTAAHRTFTLAHEQVHFDIVELVVRRMRKLIAQGLLAEEDVYGARITQELDSLILTAGTLSDQFDAESVRGGHAGEIVVLNRWRQRLTRELATLAAYKSTAATYP